MYICPYNLHHEDEEVRRAVNSFHLCNVCDDFSIPSSPPPPPGAGQCPHWEHWGLNTLCSPVAAAMCRAQHHTSMSSAELRCLPAHAPWVSYSRPLLCCSVPRAGSGERNCVAAELEFLSLAPHWVIVGQTVGSLGMEKQLK